MRHDGIIFAGPVAIVLMIFYYSIPFVIGAGASGLFCEVAAIPNIRFAAVHCSWVLSVVAVSTCETLKRPD